MKPRHRVVRALSIGTLALVPVGAAAKAQEPAAAPPVSDPGQGPAQIIDRILAVVDEDPILDSDVDRVLGLGAVPALPGEGGETDGDERSLRRQVLDRLIEERLRFHEIDRFGFSEISLAEVEKGVQGIRDRFASGKAFRERLAELGLDDDGVRQLVARQIMVLTFVEERLGPRIFIGRDEIRSYYEGTLTERLAAEGRKPPPLDSVREEIRAVLKEMRLNEEIERWTEELSRQADIQDYFDEPLDEVPSETVFRVN